MGDGNNTEICVSPFDENETLTLRVAALSGAGLSIVGSIFILISYLMMPAVRTFSYRLVMLLSISNLGSSISYYVGLALPENSFIEDTCNSNFACYLSAVMSQFFDVASFAWIAVIANHFLNVLVFETGRAAEHAERNYHLFAWGLAAALSAIVGIREAYGDAGMWCWIKKDFPGVRFFCYYLVLYAVFFYCCVSYAWVWWKVRHSGHADTVWLRLQAYVAVFVLFRVWSVIHRLGELDSSTQPAFWIALMHSIFSPLQGFANAIVYGCNKQVTNQLRQSCWRPISLSSANFANDDDDEVESPSGRYQMQRSLSLREQELEPISVS